MEDENNEEIIEVISDDTGTDDLSDTQTTEETTSETGTTDDNTESDSTSDNSTTYTEVVLTDEQYTQVTSYLDTMTSIQVTILMLLLFFIIYTWLHNMWERRKF